MKNSLPIFFATLIVFSSPASGQILINEVQLSNLTTATDEFGNNDDWIELYNVGSSSVDLSGFALSDHPGELRKFIFPSFILDPNTHVLVYASDYTKTSVGGHWETAVNANTIWRYRANTTAPPDTNWRNPSFNETVWSSGGGGIGYGDGDDITTISTCVSLYMRKTFLVSDTSRLVESVFHMDYDDSFVAYLNGVEIARANVGLEGIRPTWNMLSTDLHEAVMFNGADPEEFPLDIGFIKSILVIGTNVLAIEVHNAQANNQDMSSIPFLSFKISDNSTIFSPVPAWFEGGVDQFHANFKLSKAGETVYLTDASSVFIDSIAVPALQLDHAYERNPDGASQWCVTDQPTPDSINYTGACKTGYASIPIFNLQSGFYPFTQQLTLTTAHPQGVIRYTTNGNTPNGSSALYSSPIPVSSTMTIRARVYAINVLPSETISNTYFIDVDCKLPVYSFTTDSANLWDYYTGILVEGPNAQPGNPHWGANYWQDWEKPVTVEYFDRNKNRAFRFDAGLSVTGGWSRADDQKPLEINLGDRYGLSDLNYPLLSEKPWVDKFTDFVIHTAGNDRSIAHMRDPLMERLLEDTYVDHISFEPCLLFINGEMWGVHYTRENDDHHFIEQNYGYNKDEIDLLKESYFASGMEIKKGSDSAFFAMLNYTVNTPSTDPGYFATISTMMDIQNMVDYFAAETYYPNGDWISNNNNLKIWRHRDNGKFRYISYDFDFGLGLYNGPTDDLLGPALNSPQQYNSVLFNHFMQNAQYKNYFINRYADLINTIWLPANVTALAYAFRDSLRYDMHYQYEKWGGGDTNDWKDNIASMLSAATVRPGYARDIIEDVLGMSSQVTLTLQVSPPGSGRIQISTITPATLPWSGVYFNGNPVTVTAIPNPGFTFDHWLSNVVISTNDYNQSTNRNFYSNDVITAYFTGSPGTVEITFSEINYNSDSALDAGDWIELHNLSSQPVDISGWRLRDDQVQNAFTFPATTEIPANGYLVVAEDLQKFSAMHPSVTNVTGELGFNFSNGGDEIRLFDHRDTLYLGMQYADDAGWPQGADGGGYTLELLSASGNLNDGANWFAGCIGGSPGTGFTSGTNATVTAGGNTVFCAGNSVTLFANTGAGFTFQWLLNSGTITGATNSSYDATLTGYYSVLVTSNGCASLSDSIVVNAIQASWDPVVFSGGTCGAGSVNLTAMAADTVFWYDAPNGNLLYIGDSYTTPVIFLTTVYYVRAGSGCPSNFIPNTAFVFSTSADPVATGQSQCGPGSALLTATAADTVFWYDAPGGNLLFTGNSFQTPVVTSTTTFYAVAGSTCPSNSIPVTVTVLPLPVVNLGPDTVNNTGSSVILDAGFGFVSYLWNDGSTLQTLTVNLTGTWWVSVTDANGCSANDTINVTVNVGIQTVPENGAWIVYPNPASDILHITTPDGLVNKMLIYLTDETGREVWRKSYTGESQEMLIDLSGFARGIYFLNLTDARESSVRKVSVQ